MTTEIFRRWQKAERDAHEAAVQLQAALGIAGCVPPDHVFHRLYVRRAAATQTLREFISSCDVVIELLRARLQSEADDGRQRLHASVPNARPSSTRSADGADRRR